MNAKIRSLNGLLAVVALAAMGLGLRWTTAGSVDSASTRDLTSMAVLTVGAVAWLAYTWLLIAVLATVLEQVPGAIGSAASLVAGRITSQTSRALLRSALGVAAVTPLTLGVAHATPSPTPVDVPAKPLGHPAVPESPAAFRATEKASTLRLTDAPATEQRTTVAHPGDRPSTQPAPAEASQRAAVPAKPPARVGVPESPADFRATEKASTVDLGAGARPNRPNRPKAGRVGVPDRPTEGAPTRYTDLCSGHPLRTATQVVQSGDTLWGLAAAELGPDATDSAIAARWPHWYAANRTLIGPNPDLLHPGQVLHIPPPSAHRPEPPTHQEK